MLEKVYYINLLYTNYLLFTLPSSVVYRVIIC